jgi:hypothetical protein
MRVDNFHRDRPMSRAVGIVDFHRPVTDSKVEAPVVALAMLLGLTRSELTAAELVSRQTLKGKSPAVLLRDPALAQLMAMIAHKIDRWVFANAMPTATEKHEAA